jgi:GNAT superfamily N-acetyltransferase
MPRDVLIRPAKHEDVETIALLAGQLGYRTTTAEVADRLRKIDDRGDARVLVASQEGLVLGWVHVQGSHSIESPAHAVIVGLVVEETRRGTGIGLLLVRAAEDWAESMGYPYVRVRTNVTRMETHGFYEHLGYTSSKRQVVYIKLLTR